MAAVLSICWLCVLWVPCGGKHIISHVCDVQWGRSSAWRVYPDEFHYRYRCLHGDDDDNFTPTKHLTPPPTTAASPQRLTPTRRHPSCTKKKGRARRRTAPVVVLSTYACVWWGPRPDYFCVGRDALCIGLNPDALSKHKLGSRRFVQPWG